MILPACDLDFVAEFRQHLSHALTVFSLNFDHAVFDSSARAALLLEFFGERFQIFIGEDEIFYNRNRLPTPAARLAVEVSGLLLWWQGFGVGCSLFFLAKVSFIRRPDGAVVVLVMGQL